MNFLALLAAMRDWVALILALLISLILMNSSEHPAADTYRLGMGKAVTFLSAPFTFIPRSLNIWNENEDLREEIIRLQSEQNSWRDAILENVRLRKLLGFHDRPEFDYLASEIIAKDPTITLSSLLLDKGKRDSVKIGCAIVTASGLAGMIHRSDRSSSVALLCLDRNFAASSRVERSRVDGIIRWAGGDMLKMTDVPKNLDVKAGDRIVTSGLGGVIPGGIPIGLVVSVKRTEGLFLNITVDPFVEFSRLEEVFVLLPKKQRGSGR